MSQVEIADRLKSTILELENDRGELAEVLKAEALAKTTAWQQSQSNTDTGRRFDAETAAKDYIPSIQDLRASVDTLLIWVNFYTLLIKHDISIDLTGCPPKNP